MYISKLYQMSELRQLVLEFQLEHKLYDEAEYMFSKVEGGDMSHDENTSYEEDMEYSYWRMIRVGEEIENLKPTSEDIERYPVIKDILNHDY